MAIYYGKDGAMYNNIWDVNRADALYEQQEERNRLLKEQNELLRRQNAGNYSTSYSSNNVRTFWDTLTEEELQIYREHRLSIERMSIAHVLIIINLVLTVYIMYSLIKGQITPNSDGQFYQFNFLGILATPIISLVIFVLLLDLARAIKLKRIRSYKK